MKKTVTIKSNRDFQRLYHRGRSAAGPTLVLYWQRNRNGESRLGITTGTKLGHAVVRNRLRRQIREIYRHNQDKLQAGRDLVVVARVRAVSAGYQAMERDFLRLAKKSGLLSGATPPNPPAGAAAPDPAFLSLKGKEAKGTLNPPMKCKGQESGRHSAEREKS